MMKPVLGAAILSLLAVGPALAIAPNCQDQLAQLNAEISQKSGAKTALMEKYNEAQRLCSQNKDEEAQGLARQIREELAGKAPSATTGSGSSMPSGTTRTAPQK
jgi:hypothetical protein